MMKKLLISLLLAISVFTPIYAVVGSASAANVFQNCGNGSQNGTPDVCKDVSAQGTKHDPVTDIIKAALEIVSWVAGIAAVILILISGMKFMTAGGDPQAASSARAHLINAVIGMVIIIIAQGIIAVAINQKL